MDVLAKAKAQIADHEAKIARLKEFIAVHRELEREARQAPEGAAPRAGNGKAPAGSAKEIAAAARDIIIKGGRPMTRFELVPALQARGVAVGGKDKPRNIGTIMWRSQMFASTGEGYWPKDIER